jgi:peptide/nickel transport system substrate-binding protein
VGLAGAGLLLLIAHAGVAQGEKVVVVAMGARIVSLNPLTLNTRLIHTLFDGLTIVDDESYQPKPGLAESWTVSADRLEYVFKLRRDVVFHDGSPLTADDVRFSLEVVCHKDNLRGTDIYVRSHAQIRGCPEYRAGRVDRVEGIEVLDSHTLRVRLSEPSTAFLVSAAATGVVPRARYGNVPVKDLAQHPISRAPIGTGPFAFVEWRDGDRLVLRANSRYFLGRPKLDGLVIRFIDDPATRLLELKNGGAHFGFFAPVAPLDFAAAAEDRRLVPKAYHGVWQRFFAMDLTNPLFADVRVRRAVSHAFDRERILKDIWAGRGRIINGPVNPALREFNSRIPVPEYDPVRARRLLAEAGWQPGPDGILQKDGRRFEFSLLAHSGPSQTLAVAGHEYLRRIGMDVRIEVVDYPTFRSARFRPGHFQAASYELSAGDDADPSFHLGYFQCGSSRVGYCSQEAEALVARTRSTIDAAERAQVYWRLQEVIARDLPLVWIVSPDDLRLVSARLVIPNRPTEILVMMNARHWDLRD